MKILKNMRDKDKLISLLLILSGVGIILYFLKKEKKPPEQPPEIPTRVDLGIIPTDLNYLEPNWTKISFDERIDAGKYLINIGLDRRYVASVITASLIEQPPDKNLPNNNLLGWIPWGKTRPWGWRVISDIFERVRPIGFTIVRHGGRQASSFCFASVKDCFFLAYYVFLRKNILTAEEYWRKWVGRETLPSRELEEFWNEKYNLVLNKL
ncbi:MAG: hypothetical protein QXO40_00325 [Candidatus Aenigmatarchaeota archaeon]